MSLSAVLVDQARLHRKAASAVKVAGRTTFVDSEPGTWFPCRLFTPTATQESIPAGFISRRVVLNPLLIYDIEDDAGNPVEVRASDMLEIESEDLGQALWQVSSAPRPLRKKQGIIGYEVDLKRIDSGDFAPKAA